MMNYFASCRLFDRPLFELNAVRHVIFNLQDKYDQKNSRLWSEKNFTLYQKFIIDHRPCGVYVKLILEPEVSKINNIEDDKILIKATSPILLNKSIETDPKNNILTNFNTRRFKNFK